jgi:3(or 17)beta-hydroxysteroid dehydrogenase
MNRLTEKTALVTGGASGLGKAIAERLASDGARVFITDAAAELGADVAAREDFTFLHQDVRDEARWSEVVAEVEERGGRLDVLVNNAGIHGPAEAADPEHAQLADWTKIFAINVEGVFLGCRAALPAMRRAGAGSIINISSIAGVLASSQAAAYGASKAAVRHLTKSVAQYCAEQRLNVRCNSVHPGDVRTPLWDRNAHEAAASRGVTFESVVEEVAAGIPTGDLISPEDVAATVSFLASEDSRQMTGAQVLVDGGLSTCDTYHLHRLWELS